MSALLSARGLTRAFAGLRAVDGVDLYLEPGTIRALIGPNGAGKTTLVGLLIGRIAADAGTIRFDGHDITGLAPHRRAALGMAYTFQVTSVFPRLPVAENVALAARRGLRGPEAARAAAEALARVGLDGQGDQLAGDLSYGHQRLLEVAMGLAQRPKLLILDEPTQGLAEAEVAGFMDLIRSLIPRTTILLIEHNMGVVMGLADRITVLDAGRVIAEGAPGDIRRDPVVQAAYLGAE
ncbi:ABC transporter ATP-binding protein [Halovulum dunhuangense]|uniref:ABC transporter ATP-binding protein n=1 Tax=Halovulum dunhuangense TaxID=1505036 RepID=A0A849L3G4_9RHOB|nr:ABC transporter ATP-binding protein [Halovulum dunhuangense]NNU80855.1 ABC transporter ATP-binding protein [Halovulum dunhuangense]